MLPFSVFLRGKRPYYYVAFKNEYPNHSLRLITEVEISDVSDRLVM